MSKYIDAEKLIAELRGQKRKLEVSIKSQGDYGQSCQIAVYEKILSLINSLQQEEIGVWIKVDAEHPLPYDQEVIGYNKEWVLYAGEDERLKNKPVQVTGICMEIMQGSFSEEMYEVLSYGKINPIPIDLDILEKNGWKGGAGRNIRFKSPYILAKKNDVWTMYYNEARIVEIRYVHELQNILRMLGCEGGFKV